MEFRLRRKKKSEVQAEAKAPKPKRPRISLGKRAVVDPDAVGDTLHNMKKISRSPLLNKLNFGARFVLLIGDEGTILIHMKGNSVLSRQFVPDASEGNLQQLRETIAKDKQAPITMIIDSVDQSFIQQTLPPVSPLFVQKLIKRRLDRDFKPEDIKGAIMLGRDKLGRKDWNFLMVSIEKSPQLVLWLDFVMTFENRFRGIVLLSVEAAIFIRNLEKALGSAKGDANAEWKILVSHNKVGGFRQIILRNGKLIFTRLALPVGAPTPEIIAGNIEQEMMSTIEYLKRFGYNARNGLDVYIIASQDVCNVIDQKRFDTQNFYAFSPHTMAQYLGIRNATQPTDQFGDVVLAAAVGMIRKNILKLTTIESRLFDKFQIYKNGQRLLGTFLILGLIVQLAFTGYQTLLKMNDAEDAQSKKKMSEQTLESVKKMITDSKIDIDMVGNQIDLYTGIKKEVRSPIPFFTLLAGSVQPPVQVKAVKWRLGDSFETSKIVQALDSYGLPKTAGPVPANVRPGMPGMPPGATPGAPPSAPGSQSSNIMTATVTLEFPSGLKSPALFKKFSNDVLEQLHGSMKGYAMAYTAVPQEYLEAKKNVQMNFDDQQSQAQAPANALGVRPVSVDVSIRGPLVASSIATTEAKDVVPGTPAGADANAAPGAPTPGAPALAADPSAAPADGERPPIPFPADPSAPLPIGGTP